MEIWEFIMVTISDHFSDFVCSWALGGSNIGQNTSGRLPNIGPTRQTHSEIFFLSKLSMSQCPELCAEKTDHTCENPYGIGII